jgi:MYXO-CTERM domain-containing protein
MPSRTIFLAAAALVAAPAAAQNAIVNANTITANEVVVADPANMTTGAPVNGLTAGPGTPPPTDMAATPPTMGDEGYVTAERDSFPWGLLGALGLLGLLGRKRRRDN